MKRFVFIGIWLLLLPSVVQAEKMFISDEFEITLRTGKGMDHKIIAMLKSGESVETIESSDLWTKIHTAGGSEGWVLTRFLKSEEPCRVALEKLKEKHRTMMEQLAPSLEGNTALKEENQSLHLELARSEKTGEELRQMYENLKTESSDFVNLKKKYKDTNNQLIEATQKAEKLEDELSKLEQRQIFRWIITGAGIILLGFMIGFSAKHQRRRSSLL